MATMMLKIAAALKFDRLCYRFALFLEEISVYRYSKAIGSRIRYVPQIPGRLTIAGDLSKFSIDRTSHLKSNTFIECSGGVTIGKCFHTGSGLTIFSTNHNYKSDKAIPYDEVTVFRPVTIGDYVWAGANVSIAPGSKIGDGAILSMGSVVFGEVPECAIVRGNPARVIGYRDKETFDRLRNENKVF